MINETSSADEIVITGERPRTLDQIRDVWEHRELLYFLTWREIKVRYKQTAIGALWAVIQPLVMMVTFSLFLGKLARVPSDGIPYPLFYFSALVPWIYFSGGVNNATNTLVSNTSLVQKVYFPRIILPLASVSSGLLDLAIAFCILLGMAFWFHFSLRPTVALMPAFLVLLVIATSGAGILGSALNAVYRDVRLAVPVGLQVWLFLSPVAYPSTLVPARWQLAYHLNPMAGVIDGFRWAITGTARTSVAEYAASAGVATAALIIGLRHFWRAERTFADVI